MASFVVLKDIVQVERKAVKSEETKVIVQVERKYDCARKYDCGI